MGEGKKKKATAPNEPHIAPTARISSGYFPFPYAFLGYQPFRVSR